MRLYSWNVNGLRATLKKGLREWVAGAQPHCLCLQETKVDPATLSLEERELPGYEGVWATATRPGYSGVASFCRAPCGKGRAGLGIARFDAEGRVVVTDCGDFDLYNVYFPNGKGSLERLAYKLDFYDAFLEHINARVKAGRAVVFCGDVNTAHNPIDLARPKENEKISGFLPEERAWLDRWEREGWVDTFRHLYPDRVGYSWWSLRTNARARNVGWRLDYFYAHESLLPRVKDAGIATEVMGADHCPVWLELAD